MSEIEAKMFIVFSDYERLRASQMHMQRDQSEMLGDARAALDEGCLDVVAEYLERVQAALDRSSGELNTYWRELPDRW